MKTAVECLVHELGLDLTTEHQDEIDFFLEMEKEQMIDFACDVYDLNYCKDKSFRNAAEQCYNEIFKQEEQ